MLGGWEFQQGLSPLIDHRGSDPQRYEVRLGEITVVVRLLFAAHHGRLALLRVPQPRLLDDLAPLVQNLRLPLDLVLHGRLHELEGVDVLQLHLGAELLRADRAQ